MIDLREKRDALLGDIHLEPFQCFGHRVGTLHPDDAVILCGELGSVEMRLASNSIAARYVGNARAISATIASAAARGFGVAVMGRPTTR